MMRNKKNDRLIRFFTERIRELEKDLDKRGRLGVSFQLQTLELNKLIWLELQSDRKEEY